MTATQAKQEGFSLIELMVAMAVFMLICGAAISLFWQQQLASQTMTGQVGLNLSLRSAIAQMEVDLANAGSGFLPTANMPSWPIGVTVVNNVVAAGDTCKTDSYTYGPSCFDQLNIISADSTPPIQPTDSTGTPGPCSDTSTGTAYGQAASGSTLAATASNYHNGDQLLFLNTQGQMTSVVLNNDAVVSGGAVKFRFNATDSHGLTAADDDPLNIASCEGTRPCSLCYDLADTANCSNLVNPSRTVKGFCGSDWILKLSPVIYAVNTSDSSNPRLTRQVGLSGTPRTVMDQIIGFKVGASIWNGANTFADQGQYVYDASTYTNNASNLGNPDMAFNFTLVRSIRLSVIGRTTPDWRGTYTYRNGFDSGPYEVQGFAAVVNPRNMSMND